MTGAALWDLDGTLVDSEEYHWLAWRDSMAAQGIAITRPQFLQTFGLRNDEILPRWLPQGTAPQQIDWVLEVLGLGDFFQALVTAEDVTRGKPDPQVFLTAASRLDAQPNRCVVVEDSPMGIEAARRAGMHSIGVSRNGQLPADIAVRSLDELSANTFTALLNGVTLKSKS